MVLPGMHVLMHGWVLDYFLMLPRSESLGHFEALKLYQPVIYQEFKDAGKDSCAVPTHLILGHGGHMSQLCICELLHAGAGTGSMKEILGLSGLSWQPCFSSFPPQSRKEVPC